MGTTAAISGKKKLIPKKRAAVSNGFGIDNPSENDAVSSLAVHDGSLYASTDNIGDCQVWSAAPGITLEKNGPAKASRGDTITYEFTVTNTGSADLTDVAVTDPLFGDAWSHEVGNLEREASVEFAQEYTTKSDGHPSPR